MGKLRLTEDEMNKMTDWSLIESDLDSYFLNFSLSSHLTLQRELNRPTAASWACRTHLPTPEALGHLGGKEHRGQAKSLL